MGPIGVAVALAVAVVGCSGVEGETAGPDVGMSAAPLEKGSVTAEVYEAAYRAFQSCMGEAGYPLLEGGMYGNVYEYSLLAVATETGDYDRCYEPFDAIDGDWQLQNEDYSLTTRLIKQCLRDRGIEPAETAEGVGQQLVDNDLLQECP